MLLEILAIDGLRTVVGLCRIGSGVEGTLRTCLRAGLIAVTRPRLKPTGYGRREIPTDIASLTPAGRIEAGRRLGRRLIAVSLVHELEHRVGVGELRTLLQVPANAWTSAGELHTAHVACSTDISERALPDGLADINGCRLAIEYDHGRYSAKQVQFKLGAFERIADEAVWAAPTSRRAEWLRRLGCTHVVILPLPLGVWHERTRIGFSGERNGPYAA